MRAVAWIPVLVCLLACGGPPRTKPAAAPLAIRGVDQIVEAAPDRYLVVSSRGIGSFRVRREARQPLTVVLVHEGATPFPRLEGLTVSPLPTGAALSLEELERSGRLVADGATLSIDPGLAAIDWRVDFVDAYR
jgi:hypothetical protein